MRLVAVLLLVLPLAALAHEEREPLFNLARLQVTVSGTIQLL